MELRISELAQGERHVLVVHKLVAEAIKEARRPDEHIWQVTQRLILAGLKAEQQREGVGAS